MSANSSRREGSERTTRPPSSSARECQPVGNKRSATAGTVMTCPLASSGGKSARNQRGSLPAATSNRGCHNTDHAANSRLGVVAVVILGESPPGCGTAEGRLAR